MKRPKEPPKPRLHTMARRTSFGGFVKHYCTTCGKDLDYKDENKRCKGAKR